MTAALSAALEPWLNRVHQGDCLDLLPGLPDASIGLVVTSPPYNLSQTSGGGIGRRRDPLWQRAADGGIAHGYDQHDDQMEPAQYVDWQRRCLAELLRVLRPDGAIFYNHKWRVQNGLLQDRADIVAGFPVRQIIIWQRDGGINHNHNYFLPTYEVIYLIAKPDFRLQGRAAGLGDVWRISPETGNPHPAPFPLALARRAVAATAAQVVLDPFLGSGTTGMAARMEGRDYIGLELSGDYCRLAAERIASVGPQSLL